MLKYYLVERLKFSDNPLFNKEVNSEEIKFIFKKLKSKYKIHHTLVFGKYRGGKCSNFYIYLGYKTKIGILAHEIAHAIQLKKRDPLKRMSWHNKKHLKIMSRVMKFIEKNYENWIQLLQKKEEKEIQRIQNNLKKEEERKQMMNSIDYKLQKLLEREKKFMTKEKRIQTYLKKIRRNIKRLTTLKEKENKGIQNE